MKILAMLKSKALLILCIVLATLFAASFISSKADRRELVIAQTKLIEHVSLNKRLSDENLKLAQEIERQPAKYIPVVKEVFKEVCTGMVVQEKINSLPSMREKVNEENTADIDDRLPADLIQLLK